MVLQFHLGLEGDFLYLDEVMGVYRRHGGGVSHEIWVDGKHHHEQFLPGQVWLLWRFRDKVSSQEARNALESRVYGLFRRMVRYLMAGATTGNELAMSTIRRTVIQYLEQCKPPGTPGNTADIGNELTAILSKAIRTGWVYEVAPLLQRKVRQLGLWSCWRLIVRSVLNEGYAVTSAIILMVRCVWWVRDPEERKT